MHRESTREWGQMKRGDTGVEETGGKEAMAGRGVLKGIVEHARIVLGLQAHTHDARMRSKFEGLLMTPLFSGLSDLQRTAHDRRIF